MLLLIFLIQLPPIGSMPGWPKNFPNSNLYSTGISFADINGNGNLEVIVPMNYTGGGTLFVFDYQGNELWKFCNNGNLWLPAFADIDNDNIDEIIIGTSAGVYVLEGNGSVAPGFPFLIPNCYEIEVSIADVDNNNGLDIIFFADQQGIDTAYLYILDKDGVPLPGWPKITPQLYFTHPAVADIDNDGKQEILYNTWADSLHCYRCDGTIQPGFPVENFPDTSYGPSEIILCDIDNDNFVEIIIGAHSIGSQSAHYLYVYRCDGSNMTGWPKHFLGDMTFHPDMYHFAIGDIDNDQDIEFIITGTGRNMHILDQNGNYLPGFPKWESWGAMNPVLANIDSTPEKEIIAQSGNNRISAFYYNGEMCRGWPHLATGHNNYFNSLTVDDIDNDNLIEVGLITRTMSGSKHLFVWKLHGHPDDIEWGCPYYDLQRTCHFRR